MEEFSWLASLGVGGILAGFTFWAYRKDFLKERRNGREEQERMERREDRLLAVLADNARCQERLTGAIETLERAVRERGFGQ